MTKDTFLIYTILDRSVSALGGLEITEDMRTNGVLLRPAFAEWFVANNIIVEAKFENRKHTLNNPVKPVALSDIFAPEISKEDNGGFYMLQAMQQHLKLTRFDPITYDSPDDPGDLTLLFDNALI